MIEPSPQRRQHDSDIAVAFEPREQPLGPPRALADTTTEPPPMTCPDCHGTGYAIRHPLVAGTNLGDTPAGTYPTPPQPCPECNGTGIASCCDTAGSATGDDRPKCHPLLFADRIANRILNAPANRTERRAHERVRRRVEAHRRP